MVLKLKTTDYNKNVMYVNVDKIDWIVNECNIPKLI